MYQVPVHFTRAHALVGNWIMGGGRPCFGAVDDSSATATGRDSGE